MTFEPTIYHSEQWIGLLRSVYAYPSYTLKGEGYTLPLLRVGPLFGDRLVSIPFSDYGGPTGKVDPETLSHTAREVLEETGCDYLELRTANKALAEGLVAHGFTVASTYFSRVVKALAERTCEDVWKLCLSKKARQGVLKARAAGLSVYEAKTRSEIEEAYNVYFRAVKEMGSPSHPKTFFERLKDALGGNVRIYLAAKNGRPGGIAVYLVGRGRVHLWARYALEEYRRLGAIYLLDWTGIELANSLRLDEFDFGRTRRGSGIEVYKHHWRGEDVDIYHLCLSRRGAVRPPDPLQAKFRVLSKIWRILPDKAVEVIGPRVIRCIAL